MTLHQNLLLTFFPDNIRHIAMTYKYCYIRLNSTVKKLANFNFQLIPVSK